MSRGIELAPTHLHAAIEQIRAVLLSYGKHRPSKRDKTLPPWEVSIDGARCGLLLSEWLGGLHHFPRAQHPQDMDWSNRHVSISDWNFYAGLSTFDLSGLTRLVVLAHEHAIRVEISPAMRHVELMLHPRDARIPRGSNCSERHPSLVDLRDDLTKRIDAMNGGAR